MIWIAITLLGLLGLYMTTCVAKNHNFIDKGKYFVCTKCKAAIIKQGK
jgi:hypothetical protein